MVSFDRGILRAGHMLLAVPKEIQVFFIINNKVDDVGISNKKSNKSDFKGVGKIITTK